jgi:hypothetical protein
VVWLKVHPIVRQVSFAVLLTPDESVLLSVFVPVIAVAVKVVITV